MDAIENATQTEQSGRGISNIAIIIITTNAITVIKIKSHIRSNTHKFEI